MYYVISVENLKYPETNHDYFLGWGSQGPENAEEKGTPPPAPPPPQTVPPPPAPPPTQTVTTGSGAPPGVESAPVVRPPLSQPMPVTPQSQGQPASQKVLGLSVHVSISNESMCCPVDLLQSTSA